MLRVRLNESIRLFSADNQEIVVSGNRPQALICMIALQDSFLADRRWIEKNLWSDRSSEQAKNSLRQLLSQVRGILGAEHYVLCSDRRAIWFDPNHFELEISRNTDPNRLLSQIDVKDQKFDEWRSSVQLASITESDASRQESALPQHLTISIDHASDKGVEFLNEVIVSQTVRNLADSGNFRTVLFAEDKAALISSSQSDLVLESKSLVYKNEACLSLCLRKTDDGSVCWYKLIKLPKSGLSFSLTGALADEGYTASSIVSDKVLEFVGSLSPARNGPERAIRVGNIAIGELLTFDFRRIKKADELLKLAFDLHPHPIYLSWRCCAVLAEKIEQNHAADSIYRNRYETLFDQTLEMKDESGVSQAMLSLTNSMLGQDIGKSEVLLEFANSTNAGHPLAIATSATLASIKGDHKLANVQFGRALKIGEGSPMSHWWSVLYAISLIRQGEMQKAIIPAIRSSVIAPYFKPPLRHLYALYLSIGAHNRAGRILRRMRELEPGFSMEYMRSNPDYPVATLRNSPLIELVDMPFDG